MVLYTHNLSPEKLRQQSWKFEGSSGYIVRPCFKTRKKKKREMQVKTKDKEFH
jgi:hypothetical protein